MVVCCDPDWPIGRPDKQFVYAHSGDGASGHCDGCTCSYSCTLLVTATLEKRDSLDSAHCTLCKREIISYWPIGLLLLAGGQKHHILEWAPYLFVSLLLKLPP